MPPKTKILVIIMVLAMIFLVPATTVIELPVTERLLWISPNQNYIKAERNPRPLGRGRIL